MASSQDWRPYEKFASQICETVSSSRRPRTDLIIETFKLFDNDERSVSVSRKLCKNSNYLCLNNTYARFRDLIMWPQDIITAVTILSNTWRDVTHERALVFIYNMNYSWFVLNFLWMLKCNIYVFKWESVSSF